MDIGLPKLGGHDACRRLRQYPWGRDALMIAMTGSPEADARVMVYSVDGAKVVDREVRLAGRSDLAIPIERPLPAGSYFGHIIVGSREREFRFNVVK